jgi:Spy/CpxP family protein refolding chaperone
MKFKLALLITTLILCSFAWSQTTPPATTTPSTDQKLKRHAEMQKKMTENMEQYHEGQGMGHGFGQSSGPEFGRQGFGREMGRGRGTGFGGGMGRGHRGGAMGAMRWWKNAELAKHLNMTEVQITQLEKIWQDARLKNIDLRAEAQKQQALLQPLIESETPDESKILQQMDRVSASHSALAKSAVSEHLAMQKVLTPEQVKQLKAFHAAHAPKRMQMNMRRPWPEGNGIRHGAQRPHDGGEDDDDDIND